MKNRIAKFTLITILTFTNLLFAGAGSTGGGHGVNENGNLKVREIVEGMNCEWTSARHLLQQLSYTNRIVNILTLLDEALFIRAFAQESLRTFVCLSEQSLKPLPEDLKESILLFKPVGADAPSTPIQIAIRLNDEVFIDKKLFSQLDETNKAYLLFHEVMHGFIPMNKPARMTKLRDYISGFYQIDKALPADSNELLKLNAQIRLQEPKALTLKMKLKTHYRKLIQFNSVERKFEISKEDAIQLIKRYTDFGDAGAIEDIFRSMGIDANVKGETEQSLFIELIQTLMECPAEDNESICQYTVALVDAYLWAGRADVETSYSTGEWSALPIWEYLLYSSALHGDNQQRPIRLKMASRMLHKVLENYRDKFDFNTWHGKFTERLTQLVQKMSRNPYLSRAIGKLVAWGADLEARDTDGNTALLIAAKSLDKRMMALYPWEPPAYLISTLINLGADLSAKNSAGKSAIDLATMHVENGQELYSGWESYPGRNARFNALYRLELKVLANGKTGLENLLPEFKKLGYSEYIQSGDPDKGSAPIR